MSIQPTTHGRHESAAMTYEGRIVSVTRDRLVTQRDGEEHSHTTESDLKVMHGGSAFKIEDLKPGIRVRITTRKDDPSVAVEVECLPVGQ